MRSPRNSFLDALAILAAGMWGSYNIGYRDATAKAEADRLWVNEQMDKAGFCAWVRESSFANHCVSRSALSKETGE